MKTRKHKVDKEADALDWVFEFGCSQAQSVADSQAYQLGLVLLMILIKLGQSRPTAGKA